MTTINPNVGDCLKDKHGGLWDVYAVDSGSYVLKPHENTDCSLFTPRKYGQYQDLYGFSYLPRNYFSIYRTEQETKQVAQNYNDGKIHGWNGGECPVHPDTKVRFWLNDGEGITTATAGNLSWAWDCVDKPHDFDIIAFQVVEEYKEPLTIWAYVDADTGAVWKDSHVYTTKPLADKKYKAVKFQEVKE